MENCIFCKIARNEVPSYKVYEDENFVAFLSIYPEIEGMTIVIPKEHKDSYFVNVDKGEMADLIEVSGKVAKLLDKKLEGVLRTKLVFEGLEVPHLHAKLYPIYRGKKQLDPGEVQKASNEELESVAQRIRD